MKIVITLIDTETGNVSIECDPRMEKLAEIARGGDITPAGGYALGALAKIIKDAQQQLQEEVKQKVDSGLITPTPRFH